MYIWKVTPRISLRLGRPSTLVAHLTWASQTGLVLSKMISFIPFGGSMKIVSLLSYKLRGPRLKTRGEECGPNLTRYMANAEFSAYAKVNAAGNGYRGHGIAVPSRSYMLDVKSASPHDHENSNRRGFNLDIHFGSFWNFEFFWSSCLSRLISRT